MKVIDGSVRIADDHQFIKRPLNAYMIWTVQERKKILAKDPKMKMNDVSRLVSLLRLLIMQISL